MLAGLAEASILFLLGAGFTLVLGVTGRPNLIHGSLAMLGAYVGLNVQTRLPPDPASMVLGILAATLSMAVLGGLLEVVVLRRLERRPLLFPLLITLGAALIIRDGTLHIWGLAMLVPPPIALPVDFALIQAAVGPVVLGGLLLLSGYTRWGAAVRAATIDRSMVAALGVHQRWLCGSVAALGGGLAGLAGALTLPTGSANPALDFTFLIEAVVIALVGGIGSVTGAYVAALLLGLLQAFGIGVPVLAFAVLAVVLAIRPAGLFAFQAASLDARLLGRTPLTVRLLGGVALLLAIAAPFAVDLDTLSVIIGAAIALLFAASLHVVLGPAGIPNLGHAAFFGIGAYAAALLVNLAGSPMSLALPGAVLAAAVVALLVGAVIVRHAGVVIAMLTLVLAQTVWTAADRVGSLGGVTPFPWAGDPVIFYWVTLALCVGAALLLRRVLAAPFGYALRATRDNAIHARAIGLPIHAIRLAAFTLGGAMAGLAGGVSLFTTGRVFAADLDLGRSFDAILMIMLGGVQTLSGPIVGALTYTGLQDAAMTLTSAWRSLLGPAVIALALLYPAGIAGTAFRAWRRSP